tara:strand:- start:42 stop:197 length:156 start_codon:yes stop_codon:yes gene_type:complete
MTISDLFTSVGNLELMTILKVIGGLFIGIIVLRFLIHGGWKQKIDDQDNDK